MRSFILLLFFLTPMLCGAVSTTEIDRFLASRKVVAQIFFANRTVQLSAAAKQQLSSIVNVLQQYKEQERIIRVEGFASPKGGDRYNFNLSLQRALAVESYFSNKHALDVSVFLTGFGEKGKSDDKLIDMRRVDITVYEKNSVAGVLFDENGKIERFILR